MKLAVWNICNKADQSVAANKVTNFFEDGFDAVALQEVPYDRNTPSLPLSALISNDLGLDHIFLHTRGLPSRTTDRLTGYGTAIISTADLSSATHATLRTDRWAYMTNGKGNQRAALAFSHPASPDLRIVIGHLSYSLIGNIGATGLKLERTKLSDFLASQTAEGRIMFAGDMNCELGTDLDVTLAGIGLEPVKPAGHAFEYPTYRSRYLGLGRIQASLDRVYADPSLNPIVEFGAYGPSDHKPLHIEI